MEASKPIRNFFPNINHNFILNTLQVSLFMLKIPQHKERLKEILQITNPEISIAGFSKIVQLEIDTFENALVDEQQVLMTKITTGSAINVIRDTPIVWCFIALYWGYQFKDQDESSILKVYDWRIGDVALKFLLYFLKMKQKEISMPVEPSHIASFYTDLAARLVRIIDVLSAMTYIDSMHLKKLYFPKGVSDLALNFLNVKITYPWCADSLTVAKDRKTGKNVIQYADADHDILFYILPSRMTKPGFLTNLDKTYHLLMQLHNLDSANNKRKYSLVPKNKISSFSGKNMKSPTPIVDAFTTQLIYDTNTPSMSLHYLEEKEEVKLTSRIYRRAIKSEYDPHVENSEPQNDSERSIPNAFVQHKHNKAFSSSMCKHNLNLKSDYDIPLLEHLKSFIDFLGGKHA